MRHLLYLLLYYEKRQDATNVPAEFADLKEIKQVPYVITHKMIKKRLIRLFMKIRRIFCK